MSEQKSGINQNSHKLVSRKVRPLSEMTSYRLSEPSSEVAEPKRQQVLLQQRDAEIVLLKHQLRKITSSEQALRSEVSKVKGKPA